MGAISGNGEIDSSILNLAASLKKLSFTGTEAAAADLLEEIGLPAEMPVDDFNRWLQTQLAGVATDLSWQEGNCEVAVTSETTAAALGLALLMQEGTSATIERLRRATDI